MGNQSRKSPYAKVLWAREIKAVCPHCNFNQNVFLGDPRVFGEEPVIRCEQCTDQFGVRVGSYVDPELITESLKPISTDPLAFQVGKYLDLPLSPEMHEENNGWWTVDTDNGSSIDESSDGGFEEGTARSIAKSANSFDLVVSTAIELFNISVKAAHGGTLSDDDLETLKNTAKIINDAQEPIHPN